MKLFLHTFTVSFKLQYGITIPLSFSMLSNGHLTSSQVEQKGRNELIRSINNLNLEHTNRTGEPYTDPTTIYHDCSNAKYLGIYLQTKEQFKLLEPGTLFTFVNTN